MDKRFEPYKKTMRFFGIVLAIALATLVFLAFWISYYNEGVVLPFYSRGHWLIAAFYIFFFSVFIYIYGGMGYGYLKNTNIIFSQGLALLCANLITYLEIVLLSAKFVRFFPILRMTIIQFTVISIWSYAWNLVFYRIFPPHKLTVLYQNYNPSQMLNKVHLREDRYSVERTVQLGTSWEKTKAIIESSEAVFIYDVHAELRNKILKFCYEKGIRAYSTPKITDILVRSSENIHLFDTPLLLFRNTALGFEQRFMKRLLDIVISLLVLVIMSPFMIIIAIAIKVYDGGPIFFKQKRCTINGKVFEIHKFRSMIVDAEKEGVSIPASGKDSRITPIGKVIRATRLDELPQILDILRGHMSIVGPRPERIEHVEKYTKEIPEFSYRLKVKGGLTGYAQIYGKYNTSAYDKLKLDLMYIQNYSILLDLKLILMTLKIMFMRESTEGFDNEK